MITRFVCRPLVAIIFCLTFFMVADVHAQTNGPLASVRTDELTDDQVRSFLTEARRLGISDQQLEELLGERGMPVNEIMKLRSRMQVMRTATGTVSPSAASQGRERRITDSALVAGSNPLPETGNLISHIRPGNFGNEIFHNPRLTFEPDLRIPTPLNYRLATGDELLIDISGLSEANHRLLVSPEGLIRIPIAGPVYVNGLTIEEAKRVIIKKLGDNGYSAVRSGQTKADITLGSIRSMKVTIIGEAVLPGTFTLPSLATAFNALYACGGPGSNGTLRNVQVIRNNVIVARIDVYDFLVNGSKKNDIRLMDQDVIKINNYTTRIELKGEVKRPGFYDVLPGETLDKIISFAGGFTDVAYTEKIQVFKNSTRDRKIATIGEKNLSTTIPERGDSYVIGKILNRFSNRISIRGAVYRPGEYELKSGTTLLKLIEDADGIRDDAFTSRGTLHRMKKDMRPEIISFDLAKMMTGEQNDIPLQAEDRVTIFSTFDITEGYYLVIDGEVSKPGIYLYEQGMLVQDLVLMAGGFKEAASLKRIEIARRIKDTSATAGSGPKAAIIFQQDVSADLRDSATAGFGLQPFDEVTVRTIPGYATQKNVVVEGEVVYTGKYTLEERSQRISDLIKRAGGITKNAYLEGAVLVRSRILSATEQTNYAQGVQNLIKQNMLSGTPAALLQNQLNNSLNLRSQLLGIQLEKILDDPGSEYDLVLLEGDTLRIPGQLQTVRVNGEVLLPSLIRYDESYGFREYINRAGGFSERSLKKRSYVVHANGSVRGTKSFLFVRNYPSVKPGDEIYVPIKRERERLRAGEFITIGATLVSMMAIVITLLR
jgi:protein involved in polysaccharide export with SLBB domain